MSEPLRRHLDAISGVTMIAIYRTNMTPNNLAEQQLLRLHRKHIETCNRQCEKMAVSRLHTQLAANVLLKIATSHFALSVTNHC